MSRNLCRSTCCGNTVRLSDLRGKPIEFRRYAKEPPNIGTRWDCPDCGTAYFVIWRDGVWGDPPGWKRGFVLDLSYYESFDDEHGRCAVEDYHSWGHNSPCVYDFESPAYLCIDDAEDQQEVW